MLISKGSLAIGIVGLVSEPVSICSIELVSVKEYPETKRSIVSQKSVELR